MDAFDFLDELRFRADEMLCDAEASAGTEDHKFDLRFFVDHITHFLDDHEVCAIAADNAQQREEEDGADPGDENDYRSPDHDSEKERQLPLSQADGEVDPLHPVDGARAEDDEAMGLARPSPQDLDSLAIELLITHQEENEATTRVKQVAYRVRRKDISRRIAEIALYFGTESSGLYTIAGANYSLTVPIHQPHVVMVAVMQET